MTRTKHDLARYLTAALLLLLLSGCDQTPKPWHGHDIGGLMPDLAFDLTDHDGQAVEASDYTGRLTLLYFGFSHCKDVCQTTLATLGAALRELGPEAGQVRVLFVSVDPRRDTPEALRGYVSHFAPQVVGLTGSMPRLRDLAKRYRVSFSYGEPDAKGDYDVYHSSAIFVFDARGKARLLLNDQADAWAIAEDLRRLLAGIAPTHSAGSDRQATEQTAR